MSDLAAPLTHGQAYSDDPFYEQDYGLFGAPMKVIRYDWTIRRWRRMVVQPMRTSDDRVTVADPDAVIGEAERLPLTPRKPRKPREKVRAPTVSDLELRITAYLMEHGPATGATLARELNMTESGISKHIRKREWSVYYHVGWKRNAALWGLVGVHDAAEG